MCGPSLLSAMTFKCCKVLCSLYWNYSLAVADDDDCDVVFNSSFCELDAEAIALDELFVVLAED